MFKIYFLISPLDTKILDGTWANFSFEHATLEAFSWLPNPAISGTATAIDMKLYQNEGNIEAAKGKALDLVVTATGAKLLKKSAEIGSKVGKLVGKGASKAGLKIIKNNREANKLAQKLGYDGAEDLKDAFVPGQGSQFNILCDTKTREIFLESIKNGVLIPTGLKR